jgi:hypothetical protein
MLRLRKQNAAPHIDLSSGCAVPFDLDAEGR